MFGRKVRTIFDLLKPREIKDRILHKQQLQKMYRDPKIPRKFEVDSHKKVFVKDFLIIKISGPQLQLYNKLVHFHINALQKITKLLKDIKIKC